MFNGSRIQDDNESFRFKKKMDFVQSKLSDSIKKKKDEINAKDKNKALKQYLYTNFDSILKRFENKDAAFNSCSRL